MELAFTNSRQKKGLKKSKVSHPFNYNIAIEKRFSYSMNFIDQ